VLAALGPGGRCPQPRKFSGETTFVGDGGRLRLTSVPELEELVVAKTPNGGVGDCFKGGGRGEPGSRRLRGARPSIWAAIPTWAVLISSGDGSNALDVQGNCVNASSPRSRTSFPARHGSCNGSSMCRLRCAKHVSSTWKQLARMRWLLVLGS